MNKALLLILILASCSPQKRAQKKIRDAWALDPSIMSTDTIKVVQESSSVDTVFHYHTDSLIVNNERMEIRYIKEDSLIYLEGECYEQVIEVPVDRWHPKEYVNTIPWWHNVILVALVLAVLVLAIRKR